MTATVEELTTVRGRPRYHGANIRTWVGFRQFLGLAEEAVLGWFRERGIGPQRLYHDFGLGLSVVESSGLLPAVLEVDDEVAAEVRAVRPGRFAVVLTVARDGGRTVVLRGKVTVALVAERDAPGRPPAPEDPRSRAGGVDLAGLVVPSVAAAAPPGPDEPPGRPGFAWSWRAGYPLCHFSDRVQHSAYVWALEDGVDRFLADRGLSVGRMLAERGWIPVVSRARLRLLADAHMEEEVHCTLTVLDVLRDVTWEARMDCHVERGGEHVPVATARILHGYAVSRGPGAGALAELDAATVAALTRDGAS